MTSTTLGLDQLDPTLGIGNYQYVNLNVGLCEYGAPIRYTSQYWNNVIEPTRLWFALSYGFGTNYWTWTMGHDWHRLGYPYYWTDRVLVGVSRGAFLNDPPEDVERHIVQIPRVGAPVGTYLTMRNFAIVRIIQMTFMGEVAPAAWDNYTYDELCTPYNSDLAPYIFDADDVDSVFLVQVDFINLCMSNSISRFRAVGSGLQDTRQLSQSFESLLVRYINIALRTTPIFETVDMSRFNFRFSTFTGIQFPANLQSRALWTRSFRTRSLNSALTEIPATSETTHAGFTVG